MPHATSRAKGRTASRRDRGRPSPSADPGSRAPRRPSAASAEFARGLGWFSIGLGLTEIACGAGIARWLGMPRAAPAIRAYGLREIMQGAGILGARDPTPWIWGRVGGDVLDVATVLPALEARNPRRGNALLALIALASATAADVVCAQNLANSRRAPARIPHDYRTRSGFRRPPGAMRGAARDFKPPPDIVGPEAMRPWTVPASA